MSDQLITPPPSDPLIPTGFRIGIVGGMGPMAGVYVQQLIIEATPAEKDQDHFQVVCFTNPHVPERMRSLAEDGGRRYADAVRASAQLLVDAGATHLLIPCNTAHARLAQIRQGIDVPFVNMIDLGMRRLVADHGTTAPVGLLATVGTINEQVYQKALPHEHLTWVLPEPADQRRVSEAILAIKVGRQAEIVGDLLEVCHTLIGRGAGVILVACTELSMCVEALRGVGVPLVDPLRAAAAHLVELGLAQRRSRF
jgi:aspartate racemase